MTHSHKMQFCIFENMLLVLCFLATAQAALPLPSFMTKCTTRERVAFNACATQNARVTVATIAATGDRKYGLAPFDPVFIPRLTVEQNALFLEFTNITLRTDPPGSWHVDSVDVDLDKRLIHFEFSTPALILKGKYRVEGHILKVFDLKGSGDCEVQISNLTAKSTMDYDVVKNEKDGLEYIKLKSVKIVSNVTKSVYKFHNLFQGQEELNDAVHKIANENWKEIYEETQDSLMEAFGQFIMSVIQAVCKVVPYKNVFPE